MPFLDEVGLQTFWDICKDWFANKMTVENTTEKTTIALKTAEDETLASGEIGSATQETAGMMSAADKTKLDGIAENATANIGTITEVKGMSPITGAATQGSVTLGHADSGVSPGTFGVTETIQQTPAFGSTFEVPGFSVNSTGHVTLAGSHNVRMPSAIASTSLNGLMSAEDKQKLDGIEEGATANIGTITGVSTTAPLSGSGVSGNVTISHGASGVDAGDYGDTTDQTPEFGETFKVLSGSVNATGHLTNFKEHNVTIPDAEATTASSGLMSAEDKAKLVGIASGAEVNQNAFSNVPSVEKSPAKIIVFSSSFSEVGTADVDTLFSLFGKTVRMVSPVEAIAQRIEEEHVAGKIGIWADNDVLASGVYARVFRNWNRGFDYVGFSPDGFSTAEEGFFRFLDMYMSTGEVVPLSAVVIDDFRLSGYAASINEVASRVRSSTTDEHAVYRAILADDFKVIDAVSSIARSCYRTLRKENLFTHIIRYPLSEEYAIVRSPEANADIKYIEYNHIYVH